jgi:beta-glucosidase
MSFPSNFVWGAAAASYQIEGAAFEEGRGLSVWDVFSHTKGKTFEGDTGDVANDHYHRYEEDVQIMKDMGLHAYRLSIAWPRVLPEGIGRVNEKGLDFYDRLVDSMLAKGITPYATLFHWDFPWDLYCKGGWLNRDSAEWFADYTELMVKALGDRVKHWMTLNEPPVFVGVGHKDGRHAPGEQWSDRHLARIIHHVLLAHGRSVQAIRANMNDAVVGLAMNNAPAIPRLEDAAHIEAARQIQWYTGPENMVWSAAVWSDPMILGNYPKEALDLWGEYWPIQEGDMQTINQPLDFFGLNIYWGFEAIIENDKPKLMFEPGVGYARTMMDWAVTPRALYWGPKWYYERYKLPIMITENGLASTDWVAIDGGVHDGPRIDFLARYLREFKRAAADGVETAAYFQWSIMDNFEWGYGYSKRFGLVHVDFETQKRTLKDSAHWYKTVIETNGENL